MQELVKGSPYTYVSDIYSLSICFWEIVNRLLTGQYALPYDDIESILNGSLLNQTAYKYKRPKMPTGCPIPIMVLLGRCWDAEVESRPTASEVLQEIEALEGVYASNKHEWDSAVNGIENIQDNEETDTTSEPPSRESSLELITNIQQPNSSPKSRKDHLSDRIRSKSITDLPIVSNRGEESPTRKKSGFLRRISQIFA